MEFKILKPQKVNVTTMHCKIPARYWEDAEYWDESENNWIADNDEKPTIPGMSEDNYETWCPIIDIDTKKIKNWEIGKKFRIYYKVCDEFACTLCDPDGNEIINYEGYVPTGIGEYGDYVNWTIDENGYIIDGFVFSQDTLEDMFEKNLINF
jgi:hypothetical protein